MLKFIAITTQPMPPFVNPYNYIQYDDSNVKIDMKRMEQSIQSERFLMPQGLSIDEMETFILNVARKSREV